MEKVLEGRIGLMDVQDGEEARRKFVMEITGSDGGRVVYQLLSDPINVFRSVSLNGEKPHMHQVLDAFCSASKDIRCIYDIYDKTRWKVSYADYTKGRAK